MAVSAPPVWGVSYESRSLSGRKRNHDEFSDYAGALVAASATRDALHASALASPTNRDLGASNFTGMLGVSRPVRKLDLSPASDDDFDQSAEVRGVLLPPYYDQLVSQSQTPLQLDEASFASLFGAPPPHGGAGISAVNTSLNFEDTADASEGIELPWSPHLLTPVATQRRIHLNTSFIGQFSSSQATATATPASSCPGSAMFSPSCSVAGSASKSGSKTGRKRGRPRKVPIDTPRKENGQFKSKTPKIGAPVAGSRALCDRQRL
jgi:hypothetical protein